MTSFETIAVSMCRRTCWMLILWYPHSGCRGNVSSSKTRSVKTEATTQTSRESGGGKHQLNQSILHLTALLVVELLLMGRAEWWMVKWPATGLAPVSRVWPRHRSRSPPMWSQQLVLGDKTLCEFYLVLKCVWTRWVQRRWGGTGWSPVHWCRLFSSLTFQYLVRAGRGPGVPHRGHRASHHPPPTTSRPALQHLSYSTVQLNNIPRIYFQDKSIHSHPLKQAGLTPGRYQVWRPRYWCHRSSGIFYNQAQLTKLSL